MLSRGVLEYTSLARGVSARFATRCPETMFAGYEERVEASAESGRARHDAPDRDRERLAQVDDAGLAARHDEADQEHHHQRTQELGGG